ncbi:MAG: type III pantothenate kinase [Flavobacteriales bacterium]|nr:type III pantothenate kinase [Flavobacteriales bacterium]
MNLVLDFGNTRCKMGIFEEDKLLSNDSFIGLNVTKLESILVDNKNITDVMISSVSEVDEEVLSLLKNNFNCVEFSDETLIPIINNYLSKESLGVDRLANAVAAAHLYPDSDVLVIDAGTALTFDFISKDDGFLGGGISPGLQMRFKALHTFTDKLPLLEPNLDVELIGSNTEEGIKSGVQIGMLAEIEGIIERYRTNYPELLIIGTGGDLDFFNNKLKSHIFADSFLSLKGLNTVLNYNA